MFGSPRQELSEPIRIDRAPVAEKRRGVLERRHHPADVHVEDGVPPLEVGVGNARPAGNDAGGRDEDVDRCEAGERLAHRAFVAHVDAEALPALGHRAGGVGQVECGAGRALGGEPGRDRAADPARAAGDDGEPPVEQAHATALFRASSWAAGSPAAQSTSTITSSTPASASSPSRGASSALRPAASTIRSTTCARAGVRARRGSRRRRALRAPAARAIRRRSRAARRIAGFVWPPTSRGTRCAGVGRQRMSGGSV